MYLVPYCCGLCYVGHIRHTISERCEEHEQCIHSCHPELSALAEYQLVSAHTVLFSESILLRSVTYVWDK